MNEDNLISKDDTKILFSMKNNHSFDDFMRRNKIEKILIKNKTYYDKKIIMKFHDELEERKKIRVTEWKHTST